MRGARALILITIALIVAAVAYTYRIQKGQQLASAPPPPKELPKNVNSKAENWDWSKTENGRTVVRVIAKTFEQEADSSKYLLEGVDLRLFHKDNDKVFDHVKSAKAEYDVGTGIMYSEGDVEIVMGIPTENPEAKPSGKLLNIKSSGVRYDSKSGKATTEKPASFTFDRGEGQSTGAEYDPAAGQLTLYKDVLLRWKGQKPTDKTMEVQAGTLVYKEREQKVYLNPWSKLKRDTLTMDGADAVITLNEGVIQLVEANKARGTDLDPKRKIDYEAEHLRMEFDDNGEVRSIAGEQNAKLISTTDAVINTVTSNRVDLAFAPSEKGAVLSKAEGHGNTVMDNRPILKPNVPAPESRVMKADVMTLAMKPNGQEVQLVETHTPGTLEFMPNRSGQKYRLLNAERMSMTYGAQNMIQNFRAVNVSTRTDAEAPKGKPAPPPALTWSKDLQAEFDSKGQMTKMEQWHDFRYEEGERKARADHATLEQAKNLITLEGPQSRVWDNSGSTTADRILLNQQTSDTEAIGNVSSTRNPEKKDKKKESGTGLLSGDEPMQAKAARMTSTARNQVIHYEGNAILWQGPNRIQADRVDIDRQKGVLEAKGKVVSQFVEKTKAAQPAAKTGPVITVVRAPEMTYLDADRVAKYRGGVTMSRPGLVVVSKELQAFLKDSESDSSLDKALADGTVKIVQSTPERQRTGTSEHAEYFTADGKVILQQGQPTLVDSVRGTTKGQQLTYFSNNDRLLVDGVESKPAVSNILRR